MQFEEREAHLRHLEHCYNEMKYKLETENASLKAELAAAQAKIDRLMLEFCPEEMTEEQTDEWARSQQPAHFPFSADRVTHHKIEIAVLEAQAGQEPFPFSAKRVTYHKAAPVVPPGSVDCIGLALDLEARAKTVESQTTERAMISAANGLRLIAAAEGKK